jgi:hypothetical protein
MKVSFRAISLIPCMSLLLAVAPLAHAGTISGTAYCGIEDNSGGQGSSYAILAPTLTGTGPGTLANAISTSEGQCASFTASSINFNTGYGNPGTSLSSFLNSDPGLLSASYTAQGAQNNAPASTNTGSQSSDGTLIVLTGTAYLTDGELITLSHDDGVNLYISGNGETNELISPAGSANQTVGGQPPFTFTSTDGPSGTYSFELIYTSNYEQPAELVSSIGQTPEPSSFILLGSGLLAAAGVVRRRMTA